MPILNLGNWGYPADPEYRTRFKCRVHDVVDNMVKIEVRNGEYELVFERRYCTICFDQFLQRHLEPLVEFQQEVKHK